MGGVSKGGSALRAILRDARCARSSGWGRSRVAASDAV